MKAALEKGKWVFPTPVGYRKELLPDGSKNLEKAPLVRKVFEMAASGLYEAADILEELQALGLEGKRGKSITNNSLHTLLHNPIYYGRVRVDKWEIDTPGSFEPLGWVRSARCNGR